MVPTFLGGRTTLSRDHVANDTPPDANQPPTSHPTPACGMPHASSHRVGVGV